MPQRWGSVCLSDGGLCPLRWGSVPPHLQYGGLCPPVPKMEAVPTKMGVCAPKMEVCAHQDGGLCPLTPKMGVYVTPRWGSVPP